MRRLLASFAFAAAVFPLCGSVGRADELDPGLGSAPATPFPVPPGLYRVTDVYAGDVITSSGGTTTYTTVTVRSDPGTWARVLETVGTGEASAFDGRSFNGRARLADGRRIAGTYFQTFVLTAYGFMPVSIVFFQDDREVRDEPSPSPAPTPAPTVGPARPTATPAPIATPAGAPRVVPTPSAPAVPTRAPAPTLPPVPVVASAGVSLSASGPTLASIELLRGRIALLWPRAYVDGVAVPVRSWRLTAPADGIASSSTGSREPCAMSWLLPSPPDAPHLVRFEVTSDALPGRVLVATIAVTIRSPALLQ